MPRPLQPDGQALGLQRLVVTTSVGDLIVRAGRRSGKPATLLVHGAAGSWTTWTPLLTESDAVGEPMTDVIAIDLPGWGESPATGRGLRVAAVSAAIAEVARALGYRDWHVVGHSLGGFLALDLAARERDATLSVTLVSGTGAAVLDAVRRPVRGGVRLPAFSGMLLAMRLLSVLDAAAVALVLRMLDRARLLPLLTAPLFADRHGVDPSVVQAFVAEVRPTAFVAAAAAAARYDLERWRDIRCGVRSIRGQRDVFVGARDEEAFAGRISEFAEIRIPGAGHFAAIEQPRAVLDAVRAHDRVDA